MRIAFNLFLPGNLLIGNRDGGCRLINKKILCCRCLIFGCQPTHGRHVFFITPMWAIRTAYYLLKIISPVFGENEFVAGLQEYAELLFPFCGYSFDLKDAVTSIMEFIRNNEDLSQYPFVDMMSDAYGFVQDVSSILRKFMSVLPIYADASDVVAPAGLFLPPASPLFYDLTGIHILIKERSPP